MNEYTNKYKHARNYPQKDSPYIGRKLDNCSTTSQAEISGRHFQKYHRSSNCFQARALTTMDDWRADWRARHGTQEHYHNFPSPQDVCQGSSIRRKTERRLPELDLSMCSGPNQHIVQNLTVQNSLNFGATICVAFKLHSWTDG